MSNEAKMTSKDMGNNFITHINTLFKNWEPLERFTIEKVGDGHTTYNPNPVQYTPEFKQKVKEVLT